MGGARTRLKITAFWLGKHFPASSMPIMAEEAIRVLGEEIPDLFMTGQEQVLEMDMEQMEAFLQGALDEKCEDSETGHGDIEQPVDNSTGVSNGRRRRRSSNVDSDTDVAPGCSSELPETKSDKRPIKRRKSRK